MRAVYPGSFDPITYGHLDLIERASNVFDHLLVAVVESPRKETLFSAEERVGLIGQVCEEFPGVAVDSFDGLLVDFVRSTGSSVILRGLRAISDFEYEFQMSMMNKRLAPDIETFYMMTGEDHSFVSSSIVKEVASHGGDIASLAPEPVVNKLKKKYVT